MLLAGALALAAGGAQAGTIELIFTSTTGDGVAGSGTIEALPGDMLTLEYILNVGAADSPVYLYQMSVQWTGASLVSEPVNNIPADWFQIPLDPLPSGPNIWSSGLGGSDLFGNPITPGSSHVLGASTVEVAATGTISLVLIAANSDDILTELGGGSVADEYTFLPGTILVPEPGTAMLLAIGLVGICLRRCRAP